jgi:hypothetical protein
MTKKITPIESVKRNSVVPSCTSSFSSLRQRDQDFSLSEAVKKIADEINKILNLGYSSEDVAAVLGSKEVENIKDVQSNNSIPNIAVALLPKSEPLGEKTRFRAMASYNDSNRLPDHETRWNSR